MNLTEWWKDHGPRTLTILGSLSALSAVGLTVVATIRSMKAVNSEQTKRQEESSNNSQLDSTKEMTDSTSSSKESQPLQPLEIAELCWKNYIPPMLMLIASMACFWGAEIGNEKQQASMAAAYGTLREAVDLWQKKMEKLSPGINKQAYENAEEEIRDHMDGKPAWDERQTFYIEGYPKFIESTMEQVKEAEYLLNRLFILRGYATMNDFLELLNVSKIRGGDDAGWDAESGECWYGYRWIDFTHRHRIMHDDMVVCEILIPFGAHPMFEYDEQATLWEDEAMKSK